MNPSGNGTRLRFPFSTARRAGTFVLLLLVLATSGCVYLRLLEIKNQLREFNSNFDTIGDKDLLIQFKKPVLLARDISYLIGAEPLSITLRAKDITWYYEFEIIRSTPLAKPLPLDKLSLSFLLRGGKLVSLTVPENFLRFFPRQMFLETIRQASNAEVNKLRKTVHARLQLSPETDEQLPDIKETVQLLGPPLQKTQEGRLQYYIYRYRIVDCKRDVPIIAKLGFSKRGTFRRLIVLWDTSTLDAEYIRS
ncbi:MAG TPA: hypothetical protein P5079_06180 [Elusimicrobiota bacterium]|nr:hypothetical protein [Elusimicrobiota bacterium]